MNEKGTTHHDRHGFKWQNINISPILIIIFHHLMALLVHLIIIAPITSIL
jgi:hypothetical protein